MQAITVGDPRDEATEMGPLISAAQREKVAGYVAEARWPSRARRRRATASGFRPPCWPPSTTPTAARREEIFGPVVCVIAFADEAEAVRLANATPYGLSGSIWTRDGGRALRVARALDSGRALDQLQLLRADGTPFGGMKQSGYGRELGPHATEAYSDVKTVYYATEEH